MHDPVWDMTGRRLDSNNSGLDREHSSSNVVSVSILLDDMQVTLVLESCLILLHFNIEKNTKE